MSHQPYIDYLNAEITENNVKKSNEDAQIANYNSIIDSYNSQIIQYQNEIVAANARKDALDADNTLISEIIALL